MLEKLRKLNPGLPIFSVRDTEFTDYGKVLEGYDAAEIISISSKIEMPENGAAYKTGIPELEALDIARRLENGCFGKMDIQVGLCWGHNSFLNGLEFHKSSEINIAVTPLVLLLGKVSEIDGLRFDTKNVKGFFVDKGEIIEVYGPTLHYCPCQVSEAGFSCVVVLHKGTNEPFDKETAEPLLFRKNKWLLCHEKNSALIERNVYPGIFGENYEVKY